VTSSADRVGSFSVGSKFVPEKSDPTCRKRFYTAPTHFSAVSFRFPLKMMAF
jgi:hypothetical protein